MAVACIDKKRVISREKTKGGSGKALYLIEGHEEKALVDSGREISSKGSGGGEGARKVSMQGQRVTG